MNLLTLSIIAIIYLAVVAYLGYMGYRKTRTTSDYLVAGRKAHPFIMAISYGATFISTSAIVGFGGAAAVFGMGVLWLTVLNIFVGIFIAFAVFGKRTRQMGHHLDAHTFPELLGKRFNSRFLQGFVGLIILAFMPLYASAVLIGAARYVESAFALDYNAALAILSVLIAGYVFFGGLKGVMYTDAFQGALMFVGMTILLVFTYGKLGGVVPAHQKLDQLPAQIEAQYQAALPALIPEIKAIAPPAVPEAELFGWMAAKAGELSGKTAKLTPEEKAALLEAQPELKAVGGLLARHPVISNKLVLMKISKSGFQGWTRMPVAGSMFFYVLVTSIVMGVGIGVLAQPQLIVRFMTVKSSRELNRAVLVGGVFILMMTGVAFTVGSLSNAWFAMPEHGGRISLASVPGGNLDLIIPEFIHRALPSWFGAVFMLTLLSAAMSTLSSQFHTIGTAIGRDFFEKGILGSSEHHSTILITRIGIVLALIATVVLAYFLPEGIIAVATAIFFGLCASSFLPAFVCGLYWRGMTRAGAIASVGAGFGVSFFWLTFVQNVSAKWPAILAKSWLKVDTILPQPVAGIHWNWVEALFVGLPVSLVVAIVVSLMTKREPAEHLERCFQKTR